MIIRNINQMLYENREYELGLHPGEIRQRSAVENMRRELLLITSSSTSREVPNFIVMQQV